MAEAHTADGRAGRVSTLELFFDLVFVFTVTQLTALLSDGPDAGGVAKVVLLLAIIWWMYDGYAWLTNALSLDELAHRLVLVGGMGAFLVMALAIPTTFDDGGSGLAFGLGYLLVVALHGGLYIRETSPSEAEVMSGILPFNLLAAALVLAGGISGGDAQWILVAGAAAVVWLCPLLTSLEGFQIAAAHFVERHALVVIVALGESIVVLGVGAAGAGVGIELGLIALLGLALSASLWWTYFGEEESIERAMVSAPSRERPRLAIMFGYLHFFLLLGIVLVATGLKKATPHPLGELGDVAAIGLASGTAMFVAADVAFLRLLRVGHSRAKALAAPAALATIPLGLAVSAALQVAALAAIVAAGVAASRPSPGSGRTFASESNRFLSFGDEAVGR